MLAARHNSGLRGSLPTPARIFGGYSLLTHEHSLTAYGIGGSPDPVASGGVLPLLDNGRTRLPSLSTTVVPQHEREPLTSKADGVNLSGHQLDRRVSNQIN